LTVVTGWWIVLAAAVSTAVAAGAAARRFTHTATELTGTTARTPPAVRDAARRLDDDAETIAARLDPEAPAP
jgi:ABC-type transporter Mla subunit MlaD